MCSAEQLLKRLEDLGLVLTHSCDIAELVFTSVTDDTRQVESGFLFLDRPAESSTSTATEIEARLSRIEQARTQGAAGIVTDLVEIEKSHAPVILSSKRLNQSTSSLIARAFHDLVDLPLKMMGVTGTNGKSTIALITQYFLNEMGSKSGVLGTIINDDGYCRDVSQLTTPGAVSLISYFKRMVEHECKSVCMEVSSHALSQGRVAGLAYDAAIFTNLSGDHLDYHKTMTAYAESKATLFSQLKPDGAAIINAEDEWAPEMIDAAKAVKARVRYTRVSEDIALADDQTYLAMITEMSTNGLAMTIIMPDGTDCHVKAPLVGGFNASNLLQAFAAAREMLGEVPSLTEATLVAIFENCPQIPGRMELVTISQTGREGGNLPRVIVDYAHTHDALENVLNTLVALKRDEVMKIWVVVGAGGDRDATKRPKMAAVATKYADRVLLTSDNPRTEDPEQILRDMMTGVPDELTDKVTMEVDRDRAIAQAIKQCDAGDLVLLAGKGHEDYQVIGETKIDFDDREVARKYLRLRLG